MAFGLKYHLRVTAASIGYWNRLINQASDSPKFKKLLD